MRKLLLATLAASLLAVVIPSPAQLTHHDIKASIYHYSINLIPCKPLLPILIDAYAKSV